MKTMKIKMLRLILVVLIPAASLSALIGCQDSAKNDGAAPATNAAPAKAY